MAHDPDASFEDAIPVDQPDAVVTAEMIDAGVRRLKDLGFAHAPENIVEAVYRSMDAVRRHGEGQG